MADTDQKTIEIVAEPETPVPAAPVDPAKPLKDAAKKLPWFWLRDDLGRKSITATITMIAFWVTTLNYVLSFLPAITIFGHALAWHPFDVAACSAYMIPVLSLYFGRKFTDAKFGANSATTDGDASK
jgi:hypothetical protein